LAEDDEMIDLWECIPEMVVAVDPVTHPRDEWSGLLNIPIQFAIAHKTPASTEAETIGSENN